MDDATKNRLGGPRLRSRQVDELIGIARGLIADGRIDQNEVEFLQKWLAANMAISDQPVIRTLYDRVGGVLADGIVDEEEKADLFAALNEFSDGDFGLGELLKSTSLPLDDPQPPLTFSGMRYCFTGTFNYGQPKDCEAAVVSRGAVVGNVTRQTNFLVVGLYATESWKHSNYGNKIIYAAELRDRYGSIALISEEHWVAFLK